MFVCSLTQILHAVAARQLCFELSSLIASLALVNGEPANDDINAKLTCVHSRYTERLEIESCHERMCKVIEPELNAHIRVESNVFMRN